MHLLIKKTPGLKLFENTLANIYKAEFLCWSTELFGMYLNLIKPELMYSS